VRLDTPEPDTAQPGRPELTTPALERQDGTAGYLNLRVSFTNGHDDVSLDAHGQSRGITPLGRHGATSNVNLAWKRRLSSTLSLTVNANDLLDGSRRSYRSYRSDSGAFRQAGFEHVVVRRLYIGLVKKLE
jgi:hypothetical protein